MRADRARDLARNIIGPRATITVPEKIVKILPRILQRTSEKYFDFPICKLIKLNTLLFIRIPRNASLSLASAVYGTHEGIPHRTALFYQKSDPQLFETKTKIAVVRHPLTRIVSAYNFLRRDGTSVARPNPHTRSQMKHIHSFEQFVFDYIKPKAHALQTLDPTVHSQAAYVCDEAGRVIVENIFKFEDLQPLKSFLQEFGIETVAHENQTDAGTGGDYLSEPIIAALQDIYRQEFALFNYAVTPERLADPASQDVTVLQPRVMPH